MPLWIGPVIMFVVGVVMRVGEWAITRYQQARQRLRMQRARIGPGYGIELMAPTTDEPVVIPVVMGRHRVAGIMLQEFTRRFEEGVDELHALDAVSQGPISAITDMHLDGNDISNFRVNRLIMRLGTNDQSVIPDCRETVQSAAQNTQLLYGSAVTLTGTITASKFVIKLTAVSGLYYMDREGNPHSTSFHYRIRWRPSAGAWGTWNLCAVVNADSGQNTTRLYIAKYQGLLGRLTDLYFTVNPGGPREERVQVSGEGEGYVDLEDPLVYDHTAAQADEVVLVNPANFNYNRRNMSAFSWWHEIVMPSAGVWDLQIERMSANHDGVDVFADIYLKEFQEVAFDDLVYPRLALAYLEAVAAAQMNGGIGRRTYLVDGILVQQMASATTFSAAAWTRNPADLMLALIYNCEWGMGSRFDRALRLTMSGGSGNYTIGEIVTGPASGYRFYGRVKEWTAGTLSLVLTSLQGLPYGTLTGATSGAARSVGSVDEAHAVNLSKFWTARQFCEEYVSDMSGDESTVDAASAQGQPILYVAATTPFAVNDYIIINPDGPRQESGHQVQSIQVGVSLTLIGNLLYPHTALQADEVHVAEKRSFFDHVWAGTENDEEALQRIARAARCMKFEQDGKICLWPLRAETPAQLVCDGNTIFDGRDTMEIRYPATADRPNRISIEYTDETQDYRRLPATHDDPAATAAGEAVIQTEIEGFGVTRRSQALRLGYLRLKKLRYCGKVVEFRMGIESLNFEAGDVFYLANRLTGHGHGSGRVQAATSTTVTLDHPVSIPAGTITILVRHQDDTMETQTIASAAGTHKRLSITGSWTQTPANGDIYCVGTPGRYRALLVEMDENLRAKIQAEQDDTAFYLDDAGMVPAFTIADLPDPDQIPPDVTGLVLSAENAHIGYGQIEYAIRVGWIRPLHNAYSHAEVWSRELNAQAWAKGKAGWTSGSGNGEFNLPRGCCRNSTHIFVADTHNDRIVKLLAVDGSFVANIGSSGTGDGQFRLPADVWANETHIFVADSGNHRIQKLTVAGVFTAKIGSLGSGVDQFNWPNGISGSGALLVIADTFNHRIVKLDNNLLGSGGGTWATVGTQGVGNDQFSRPMGIDTNGTWILVADTANNRIHKRVFSTMAYDSKIGSAGTGNDNFQYPMDVAINSAGTLLWVADTSNQRVHERNVSNLSLVHLVGQTGVAGNLRGLFDLPAGLAHYGDWLAIVDRNNHRVQVRDDGEETAHAWQYHVRTADVSARILDRVPGETYEVAVVSVSPYEIKKAVDDAPSATVYQARRTTVPPNVSGLTASNSNGQVLLRWTAVACGELGNYEIRVGDTFGGSVFADWASSNYAYLSPPPAGQSRTYYVRARTTSDIYSATPASVTYNAPVPVMSALIPNLTNFSTNWRT